MPTPTNTLIPEKYDYNQIAQRLSTLQPSEDIGTRMGKAFADSATGIVQNLVEVGADIHDTVVPEGYESMLNPLAKGIESVKEDIGYRSGIDFQGMQEGLRNDGLSGFWSKFKFEDIPELMAQSFPYMVGAYNAAGFAAISASMAKEMAKNTAVNEGRDPNQTTLSDTLTALPAGMAITALDSLIPNTMTANVMKSIVGRSATTAANRVADRGISTLIKDVATSVVTEGATESVQELIQFAQEHKGQGVLSPEALSQYGVAGLLGGMSGGTMNVAMKPVETISSIMPSKTTKPAIDSLEAGEIDTRQVDILNKKVNTDTFQSLPEEEKMNIIDNAVFDSPLEVIDNKAKVVLSDGSGMFEVDLTIADDATSFGKLIRSDGTEVELTGGYGQYLDMIYGSIYNKIQSFDTVESLNKFMEQSGLDKVDPTNNVVHTAVANKAAEIQSMLLNEKAKSQTKGSFGTGIDTSNLYGAMNDIHTNFMKEMTNKTEKELFASIGRLVFNPDTLQPRNRQASKKVQALKDLVTAEEQYMLYRYIQQYGNVNNSNTKKVAAFIEKQYGIKTTYYNKIGMFKFSSISEPVVEQPIIPAVSPSPKIEIQPTSTTTGSDMEIPSTTTSQITPEKYGQNGIVESNEKTDNKPEKRKQSAKTESIVEESAKRSITIGDINVAYESVPEDSIKSLAVNGKDGIKIQKNITKDKFIKYLKGELANDTVSKNIIAIKQQADNMMKAKYGKSLTEIVDKLSDNDIRKFILLHEHRHNMQKAVDRSNSEYKTFIEAYKANPAKFEFDANEFALLKMGLISKPKEGVTNGLQEQKTTEEVSSSNAIGTKENPIQIYSDGSDIKGTGKIGYGSVFVYNDVQYALSGTNDSADVIEMQKLFPDAKFSNPTMEMLALSKTLETFAESGIGEHIQINQDYKGAVNYNELWNYSEGSNQREPKAWKAKEKYIKYLVDKSVNAIKQIEANGGSVSINWVKGHSNNKMNDLADTHAKSREEYNNLLNAYNIKPEVTEQKTVSTKQEIIESNIPVEEDVIYDVTPTDTKSINSESIVERENARLARANKFISTGKKYSEEFSVQAQNLNLNHYADVFSKAMSALFLSKSTIAKLFSQSKYASSEYSKDLTFIDTFGLDTSIESNTDKRNFFMKTALLSGVNAVKNNSIVIIDPLDTDNPYNDILPYDSVLMVNKFKGVPFPEIISSIANNIAREFRLKPANKEVDPYAVNLQAYQGALYAYAALKELGYLEESNDIRDREKNVHRFVRITDKGKSTSDLFDVFIKEMSSRDTVEPNIIGMVDESERNNVDRFQKGTHNIKVSETVSEAIRILQNQDIQINEEMSEIFESGLLDDEEFVNNVIDYENPNDVHINFKENIEAMNASYKYVLGKLRDFVSTTGNQKFWLKYQINRNGRYQPYATVANPVTDKKFARWMLDNANENSFYEVGKEDNETTYMWKHAIVFPFAEAGMIEYRENDFNVSFEKPDKKDGRANLNAFDKLADLDFMKEAIKLMNKGKKAEAYKIISPAGFHGIRAFIDYYKYYNLKEDETFKTAMPTEVDGLTNGLSQQISLLGNGSLANSKDLLNMVGFFTKNQDIKNLYTMRNNGNLDIYEYLSNDVSVSLRNMPIGGLLTSIKAIGRNLTKSPTIVWLYNAGEYGIEMKVGYSITESFLNTIWKNKDKITKNNLTGLRTQYYNYLASKFDIKEEKTKIDKMLGYFDYVIKKSMSKEMLSESEFSFLESMFANIVGVMVTEKMNNVFSGIAEYKAVFAKANHFINTVMYAGYKVLGDDIYKHQILIQGNKESKSGISPTREDRVALPEYNIGIKYKKSSGGIGDLSVNPIRKQMQNPTIIKKLMPSTRGQKAGFVLAIHNKDSNDIAQAMINTNKKLGYVGFSIFDASSMSAAGLPVFMQEYNHSTYNNSSTYSIPKAYIRALNYAQKLVEEYPKIKDSFSTSLVDAIYAKRIVDIEHDSAKSLIRNTTFDNSFRDVMNNLTDIDSRITAYRESIYNQKLDTALDYNAVQQMSGIEPYKLYKQSLSQGSSSDSITGTLTETRVLKKDTNDFVELFDEIKQLDEVPVEESHSKYLRDLVGYIQNRLGDYQKETKVDIYKDAVSNAGEYYAENIKLSIGNKVSSYAYQSMQEIYAHELVHKAVDKAFKTDAKTRNELNVIFNKFIDYVKSNNTTLPKATFDYILSVNDASEFASYAVTNKDVMNVLEQIPSTLPSKSTGKRKTMFEILSEAVKLMISKFMTVTRLENSSLKLLTAKNAREEVDIVIAEMMAVNKQFNSIKKDNIFNQTYKGIGKVNAPISSAIQATTRVIKTSPIGRAFHDSLVNRGMMYRLANNQFVRAFSNEIVRRPKEEEALLKLTKLAINTNSNYINQKRAISNAVNDALNNATTQDRIALKNILLDLDCVSVFNDAKEIGEYLNNKALRYQKIKDIQNSILSMAKTDKQKNYARFIINQAIGLGYNLATHDSILNQAQLLNADNITNFKLVNHSKNVENFAVDKVTRELLTKQVDLLATLYGINNSKMSDVALAGKYIAANTSAIDNILEFQLAQVNRSKEQLFNLKGESHLYMKGYSATMLNPNDQYTVIEESKVAGMKKQGWKVLSDVVPTDIKYSSTQHKMVLMRRINVDPNYASGIISVQSPTSKGTTLNQIGLTLPKEDNKINVDSYISNVISDISTMPTGQMIPLLSPSGKTFEVANYRYMMTKNNKTALLGMINDISTVMAETYAMTERKIRENQDNYDLVKAINKDYAEHTDSGEFVKIDNDGEYKDYWRMLPRDTRNYITRHNGEGFIYVRKQLINELFGYTNATVSQALRLKEEHYVLELMEKIWKDMIGIIRNSIVIRTFKVVYDNMFSNFRSVMLFMPADKAFKYMKEAWVLTDQYRKDHDKLTEIEARIASGKPYDKALHSRLKKAVESNPVIELFQEGKFEAIVDDLNIEEHDKRNIVEQKIEQLFDKINSKAVRDAADLVYIGEDTALYKALSKATIYGDFIARYAIYRHLRESNVSKDEAITTIDDMFVKYSVLQNKWIKWTGDMGMFVFSSYFFRIQRGIYRAFRDKSAYVGSQYAIEKITGDTSDITDSFIGGANITARLGTGFRNINEVVEPHLLDNLGLI